MRSGGWGVAFSFCENAGWGGAHPRMGRAGGTWGWEGVCREGREVFFFCWGRGSGGVESTGVSQSVRETSREKCQRVPSPEELFQTRDLELPIFEGSLPSGLPHPPRDTPVPLYTCTSLWPIFVCFFFFFRGRNSDLF